MRQELTVTYILSFTVDTLTTISTRGRKHFFNICIIYCVSRKTCLSTTCIVMYITCANIQLHNSMLGRWRVAITYIYNLSNPEPTYLYSVRLMNFNKNIRNSFYQDKLNLSLYLHHAFTYAKYLYWITY